MASSLNDRLNVFTETCRRAGLRITPQRIEIFRELAAATDHPSAESLHQRLLKKMPTLSLDTVYRTLATFAGYNLVSKIETIDSQARFEVRDQSHHHLICKRCREIVDFHWPALDHLTLPGEVCSWGKIVSKNLVVYGVCSKCLPQADR